MTAPTRPVCKVCHRPLEDSDQYLVRFDAAHGTTVVHRSLCFPPPRTSAAAKRAATPA